MIQLVQQPSITELRDQLRTGLNQLLNSYQDRSVLLLVSGGSVLSLLDKSLTVSQPKNITLTVVDERFSADPEINNFLQLQQTPAYQDLVKRGSLFISTVPGENESLSDFAGRFEAQLKAWRAAHEEGAIVALLGIGPDGHTAGILPDKEQSYTFNDRFIDTDKWVTGYESTNRYPFRVTVTGHFLTTEVGTALVYAVGQEKEQALTLALSEDVAFAQTPAALIRKMKSVTMYTDQAIR